MKKLSLLPLLLLGGMAANAQHHTSKPHFIQPKNEQHLNLIQNLLASQGSGPTAQKPTGTQQRVIAQSFINQDLSVGDSTKYKYSGTKGSIFNHNNTDLNYPTYFTNNYLSVAAYSFYQNPNDLQADTITTFYGSTLNAINAGYYNTAKKLDSFYVIHPNLGGTITEKYYNKFNTQGFLSSNIYLNDNSTPGTFDTSSYVKYYYNAGQNVLLSDTTWSEDIGGLVPLMVTHYHYDGNGNMDSASLLQNNGTYDVINKVLLQYNAANQITKVTQYSDDDNDGTLTLQVVDSFGYTNNINYYTFWSEDYYDAPGVLSDQSRVTKYPGANGQPDSAYSEYNDGGTWVDDGTFHYVYNSFDNPISITNEYEGEFQWKYLFYYEEYQDGTSSVNNIAKNTNFNVYPNPFSNTINIDWKGKQQEKVKVSLVNILGQEVFKANSNLNTGTNNFTIPTLAAGNYVLMIQDASGKQWSAKMLKK